MESIDLKEAVEHVLSDHIRRCGLRKTIERSTILSAVYDFHVPFDIDELLQYLEEKKQFHVCRGTLYNTLTLLCSAHLVIRHPQMGEHMLYEGCYGAKNHLYTLCDRCGKLRQIPHTSEPVFLNLIKTPRFHAENYLFYVHGICNSCAAARKRKERKKEQNNLQNKKLTK